MTDPIPLRRKAKQKEPLYFPQIIVTTERGFDTAEKAHLWAEANAAIIRQVVKFGDPPVTNTAVKVAMPHD